MIYKCTRLFADNNRADEWQTMLPLFLVVLEQWEEKTYHYIVCVFVNGNLNLSLTTSHIYIVESKASLWSFYKSIKVINN